MIFKLTNSVLIILIIILLLLILIHRVYRKIQLIRFEHNFYIYLYQYYRINNIYLLSIGTIIFIFFNFLLFVIIRIQFLGISHDLAGLTFTNKIEYSILLHSALMMLVYILCLNLISSLFYKNLLKIHFYLYKYQPYNKMCYELAAPLSYVANYMVGFIPARATNPLFGQGALLEILFGEPLKNRLRKNIRFYSELKIEPAETKSVILYYRKLIWLQNLSDNNNYIQNLLLLHYAGLEYFKQFLQLFFRISPELILCGSLAFDIYNHKLYLIYYASLIYTILIVFRKLKKFYYEADPAGDEQINDVLYGEGTSESVPMGYLVFDMDLYLHQYIKRGFKCWTRFANPDASVYKLTLLDLKTKAFAYTLIIPWSFITYYYDSYRIILNSTLIEFNLPVSLLCIVPLAFLIYVQTKIVNKDKSPFFYKKGNLILYLIMFILQIVFYSILILKNSILFSANEIIFSYGGLTFMEVYTLKEKAEYALEYLQWRFDIANIHTLNIYSIITQYGNNLYINQSLELIRSNMDTIFTKYIEKSFEISGNLPTATGWAWTKHYFTGHQFYWNVLLDWHVLAYLISKMIVHYAIGYQAVILYRMATPDLLSVLDIIVRYTCEFIPRERLPILFYGYVYSYIRLKCGW